MQIQAIDDHFSISSSRKLTAFDPSNRTRQSQNQAETSKENDKKSKQTRAKSTGSALDISSSHEIKRQTEPEPDTNRENIDT